MPVEQLACNPFSFYYLMPTPSYITTCLANNCIAEDIYEIRFTKPEGLTFEAGQFVLWDVPLVDDPKDIQPRAYSIASAPHEEELLFIFKALPGGRSSRWVREVLTPGTEVRMQGPFGLFTLQESPKDILFLATSTGVAPLRSHIVTLLKQGDTRKLDLIYSVKTESEIFWKEEFEALARGHFNFSPHLTVTRPSENWQGLRGRTQAVAGELIANRSERTIYVCGNPEMTKEGKCVCLEEWNVPKDDVHIEGYV
jgi:ferredoxin-NADP reductase